MLKGIKIRLYFSGEQESMINRLLGSYRFVYNSCLSHKIDAYETEKKSLSLSGLGKFFHGNLRNEFDWLQEHNTKVLKQSIINLETAYKNFFKDGKGFPKFKSRHDVQKVRIPSEAIASKTFDEDGSRLNLTKTVRNLKFKCSNRDRNYLYKNKKRIKSVTIIKNKAGQYYATILIDGDLLRTVDRPKRDIVGIDLGIKTLLTLSDGQIFENNKYIRSNEKKLKKLHKQLSKKQMLPTGKFKFSKKWNKKVEIKLPSKNREKAVQKLAKVHQKIKNQKLDYLHNITTKIVSENQVIVLEDLNVSGMMKNHSLAKSIQELGLYEMRRQFEYKTKWYGRELVLVSRWFPSSKTCSSCGWKNNNLKLSDRELICEECGLVIDRDENASLNIENEGLRILEENMEKVNFLEIGQRLPEFGADLSSATPVDCPLMDDPIGSTEMLRSNGRLKQEEKAMHKIV